MDNQALKEVYDKYFENKIMVQIEIEDAELCRDILRKKIEDKHSSLFDLRKELESYDRLVNAIQKYESYEQEIYRDDNND